jgi:EmrB/QacA subfamily drug resistance transporter
MTNTQHTSPPASGRARLGWVLGLTSAAYFMVVLDSSVVLTALPQMQRDLRASLPSLQWTVNAYGISFAAGIITAAALGDRFGRRRIFNLGLALFTLASAACALAPGTAELVAGRTVQGLGAAAVMPLSLTILTAAFPARRRGMIVGIYGGLAGLAVAAGPLVGGAVTEGLDWNWIFWLNVPIGLIAVALASRLLPETHGAPARLDLPGVTLVTAGVIAIVWALVRASDTGWSSPQVVAALLAGAVLLAAFVARESRAAEPLVPLRLFRNRTFAVGNATMFFMSGAIFSAAFLILQEFQFARGYSPVAAGARLLPFFATPMLVSPLAGAVSDRIGRRPVMVTGLTLQALGFTWVAARGSLSTSWIELMLALLVAGIGISMALPTVPTAVLSAVALPEMGKASGINQMAQRLGTVFAIAISSAVFSAHGHLGSPAAVTAGFRPALWSCVVFAALAAVTAAGITARLRCGQRDQASRRSPHRRLIHRTERNDQCPTSRATRSAPPTATTPTSPSTPRSIPSSPPCPPLPG